MYAAQYGHVSLVRLLVEHGAALEATNIYGWTAAHSAAYYGKLEAVRVLVDSGCRVNALNGHGCTPLASAAKYGYVDCCRLLLSRGADKSPRNLDGESAADLARACGCDELVALLS